MLYTDPDNCVDCCACEAACPIEAIFAENDVPEEWQEYIEINTRAFASSPALSKGRSNTRKI